MNTSNEDYLKTVQVWNVSPATEQEYKPWVTYISYNITPIRVGHTTVVETGGYNDVPVTTGKVVVYDKATEYFETQEKRYILAMKH